MQKKIEPSPITSYQYQLQSLDEASSDEFLFLFYLYFYFEFCICYIEFYFVSGHTVIYVEMDAETK